jgi:hypothetical protein
MYVNMSITTPGPNAEPYTDTPTPRVFNQVSPLDAELFSTVNAYVDALVKGDPIEKYSPPEVAQWLDGLADKAEPALRSFDSAAKKDAKSRMFSIDVAVQCALARFFAAKLRVGSLYAVFDRTKDQKALSEAIRHYSVARDAWTRIIERTKGVYMPDVSYGIGKFQRGHWEDRLPAIDADIELMKKLQGVSESSTTDLFIAQILKPLTRPTLKIEHTPAAKLARGSAFPIEGKTQLPAGAAAELRYRHIHQAEAWQSLPMTVSSERVNAEIPGAYTDTAFPIQYYFMVRHPNRSTTLVPGLGESLTTQPYFLVRTA